MASTKNRKKARAKQAAKSKAKPLQRKPKPSRKLLKPSLSTPAKPRGQSLRVKTQKTKARTWRDAKGRFASPVYYDGKRYRRAKDGRPSSFASRGIHPSAASIRAAKHPPKPQPRPVVKEARPPRPSKLAKPPRKPAKPRGKLPKAKAPKKPRKPRKRKPTEPKKPQKTPLPQIFGKNRDEVLTPIKGEIRARILEAEALVRQAQERGHDATDLSEIGYEYYQLIAAVEAMSPHDIYTLFKSPDL